MKIQESGEMYLETIFLLHKTRQIVRAIDVGTALSFSKPSVSRAMGILKQAGFIIVEDSGNIALTQLGFDKATQVYERHIYISKFLVKSLGIDNELADQDACKIEHVISQEVFDKMKAFVLREETSK